MTVDYSKAVVEAKDLKVVPAADSKVAQATGLVVTELRKQEERTKEGTSGSKKCAKKYLEKARQVYLGEIIMELAEGQSSYKWLENVENELKKASTVELALAAIHLKAIDAQDEQRGNKIKEIYVLKKAMDGADESMRKRSFLGIERDAKVRIW